MDTNQVTKHSFWYPQHKTNAFNFRFPNGEPSSAGRQWGEPGCGTAQRRAPELAAAPGAASPSPQTAERA